MALKAGNEELAAPVILFTERLNVMPTLCVVATFGQWYPEELETSLCLTASDVGDCDQQLNVEKVSSGQHRLSSKSAAVSESGRRSDHSTVFVQHRTQSYAKPLPPHLKHDVSEYVWTSSEYSQVLGDTAVRLQTVSTPWRVKVGDRLSSMRSHITETSSAKTINSGVGRKSAANERHEPSYNHQTKRSDVGNKTKRSSVIRTNCTAPETGLPSETCTAAGDRATLFESSDFNSCRAVEGTIEHNGAERANFVQKLLPILVWSAIPATDSNEYFDNLPETDVSSSDQTCMDLTESEALVEGVGHEGTEGFRTSFELTSTANNNNSENTLLNTHNDMLCNENLIDNTISVQYTCNNISNSYSVKNDNINPLPDSMPETISNHLEIELDNNTKETNQDDKMSICNWGRNCLNSGISVVPQFKRRRYFSFDDVCIAADVYRSPCRASVSCESVHPSSVDCTWSTDRGGRGSPAVTWAGLADCLQLPDTTWSDGASEESHLTADDQADSRQQTRLADEFDWQTGALSSSGTVVACGAEQPHQSFVVAGLSGAVDAERLVTAQLAGVSLSAAGADNSPPPLGVPPPTAARPASAAFDTASYVAELQSCLPGFADLMMGQSESSTDDVDVQKKSTVESVDISSTLVVSVGESTGHSEVGAVWNSLLNPAAQSDGRALDVLPTRGDGVTETTSSSRPISDDDDGHVTADAHGWSSTIDDCHSQPTSVVCNRTHSQLTVDSTDVRDVDHCDTDAELYSRRQRSDEEGRCSELVVNGHHQQSRLSSQPSPPPRRGYTVPVGHLPVWERDACPTAGGSDERLIRDSAPPPPPPAADSITLSTVGHRAASPPPSQSDGQGTRAADTLRVSDDEPADKDLIESSVETDRSPAAMASDATPPQCAEEVQSTVVSGCDVSDHVTSEEDGRSEDDDDVDTKLAVELERLKSLVSSPKTSTADNNNLVSSPCLDETQTVDCSDVCDITADNDKHSINPSCSDRFILNDADLELPSTGEQRLQSTDAAVSETGFSADATDSRLRECDGDYVMRNTEPAATDNLPPVADAAASAECTQLTDEVSGAERTSKQLCSGSDCSLRLVLDDDSATSTAQQSVDNDDRVLNSAASSSLVDVILEAEQSLLSSLGITCNTRSNTCIQYDVICNTHSVVPQYSQTVVNDKKQAIELSNGKLLKCDHSRAVSSLIGQNYPLECPKNVSLGDDMNGKVGVESTERDGMSWSELKVLREMFYAEQRLLQLHGTCQQVAHCHEVDFLSIICNLIISHSVVVCEMKYLFIVATCERFPSCELCVSHIYVIKCPTKFRLWL